MCPIPRCLPVLVSKLGPAIDRSAAAAASGLRAVSRFPAASMAQLRESAMQYQRALDGLSPTSSGTAAAEAAADAELAFRQAINAAIRPLGDGSGINWTALHPIILHSTLAASIVAHFGRIPWTALTQRMLSAADGSSRTILHANGHILWLLFNSVLRGDQDSATTYRLAALLLRQV